MDNKLEVNGNLYGVGIAQNGAVVNQNIILPKHKTPTQLTLKLGEDAIVGRAKELQEIDTLLKESSSLLLINGIGGIGKSTIASYYLHSQKEKLDYYGFFEGLESFTSELREPLALQQEKEDDAFIEALSKLRNLKGNKLLVFDDVKDIEENQDKIEKILALKDSRYKILLTSREEIEDIEQYYLDVLSLGDAKELFNSIYKVEDEVLLEEILVFLDCHAFFVEMTAKTLKSKKTLTAEIIKDKFENGEFSTIKRNRKKSFNDYLNKLFSFDELDDEEILMLKQLSVLPSIEIEFEFLEEIFDKEGDENFEEILNYLCEKGWLSSFENGYKLHQVVKEFLLLENNLVSFEEIEQIFKMFSSIVVRLDSDVKIKNQKYFIYLESLIKILDILKIENNKVFTFIGYCGKVFSSLGRYKKAEEFYIQGLRIKEKILGKEHYSTATSYGHLANLYKIVGNYEKADFFYNQALKVREKVLDANHPDIAKSYNNKAGIYMIRGDYEKAEECLLKALESNKKNLELEPLFTSAIFNGLADIYEKKGSYKEAKKLFSKTLEINKSTLGLEHPKTAVAYNKLGGICESMENYKDAEIFYLKALDIQEKILGEDHLDTTITYTNLANFYNLIKKYNKVESLYQKALKTQIKLFNIEHYNIAIVYFGLASFYFNIKKYQESNDYIQKALNIFEKINHPYLNDAREMQGKIKFELLRK